MIPLFRIYKIKEIKQDIKLPHIRTTLAGDSLEPPNSIKPEIATLPELKEDR